MTNTKDTKPEKSIDGDQPLISGRSPSISRSQKEWANPSPTTDPNLIAALSRVVELSLCASAVITETLERMPNKDDLISKRVRCNQCVANLTELISTLGASAPTAEEIDGSILPFTVKDVGYAQGEDAIRAGLARNDEALASARNIALELEAPDDLIAQIKLALTAPSAD